jgi:thioredoxin-related protein
MMRLLGKPRCKYCDNIKKNLKRYSVTRCEIGRNHSVYDGRICYCVEGNEPLKFHTNKDFLNQLDDRQLVNSTVFSSVCNPRHEDKINVSLLVWSQVAMATIESTADAHFYYPS